MQLLSVHAFICQGESMKQVPLMFCLMSRRTKDDYVGVFRKMKEAVGGNPEVEGFVLDFEKAAWLAIRDVFPDTTVKGCVFHWTQAVWRKIQDLGLKPLYGKRNASFGYMRKILALPFLPHASIEAAFESLKELANTAELRRLCGYVESTWLDSTVWSVRSWSVYRKTVRTNNDCEGWHQRINRKARSAALPFYLLVPMLKVEAELIDLQMRLVSDHLLSRRNRPAYHRIQGRIHSLWERLDAGDISTSTFLGECAKIYGPTTKDRTARTTQEWMTAL